MLTVYSIRNSIKFSYIKGSLTYQQVVIAKATSDDLVDVLKRQCTSVEFGS